MAKKKDSFIGMDSLRSAKTSTQRNRGAAPANSTTVDRSRLKNNIEKQPLSIEKQYENAFGKKKKR